MRQLPIPRPAWVLLLGCLTLAALRSPSYGQDAGAATDRTHKIANAFISVKDGRFVDAAGRHVTLHGINVGEKSKAKNYLSWHGPEQFAAMREWGFNCIRLLIIWDGLEPEPGRYDDAYLSGVDKRIAWAKRNGIYVLLDMHQDLYSAKFGADGAPLWATLDDGKPHVSQGGVWSNAYLTSKAVQTAFDNFWANTPVPTASAYRIGSRSHGSTSPSGTPTRPPYSDTTFSMNLSSVLRPSRPNA